MITNSVFKVEIIYLLTIWLILIVIPGCASSRSKPNITMYPECLTGPEAYCWAFWKNDYERITRCCRSRRDIYDPEANMKMKYSHNPKCIDLDLDNDYDVDLRDVCEALRQ